MSTPCSTIVGGRACDEDGLGVAEITSADGTVVVTNPFGPVTDLSAPDVGDLTGITSVDGSVAIANPGGPIPDLSCTAVGATVPTAASGATALAGVSADAARADHKHNLEVAVADEGVAAAPAHSFDFVGAGVSMVSAAGVATVTIPGGAGSGDAAAFVFDTAGVAGGNVYTTWATLVAAVQAVAGVKTILVLTSATIPAGGHALPDVWIVGPHATTVTLDTADGVNVRGVIGFKRINITSSNTATNAFDIAGRLILTDGATVTSKDGLNQAILLAIGPVDVLEVRNGAQLIGNEDDPVVMVPVGAALTIEVNGGRVNDQSIVTSGGGTVSVLNVGSDLDRNQGLTVVGMEYGNPNDNPFLSSAGGQLPSASFDRTSQGWVELTGNVTLPEATRSAGPHHVVASAGDRTVSLSNPTETLQGNVAGTITIPRGESATFKSDGVSAWIVAGSSGGISPQYFGENTALPAGNDAFVVPNGMNAGDIVLAGGPNTVYVRASSGQFRRLILISSIGTVAGDVEAFGTIGALPRVSLGTFGAAAPSVPLALDIPLDTFAWVDMDTVQLSIESTLGVAVGNVGLTVMEGWH